MEIKVTEFDCVLLWQAAVGAQAGQPRAEARKARALAKALKAHVPSDLTAASLKGTADTVVSLTTEDMRRLHWTLDKGDQWPFEKWDDATTDRFDALVERMEKWIEKSEAKDKFDAMSESDKRAALAQANKENK